MKATRALADLGQSLWLDHITRDLVEGGTTPSVGTIATVRERVTMTMDASSLASMGVPTTEATPFADGKVNMIVEANVTQINKPLTIAPPAEAKDAKDMSDMSGLGGLFGGLMGSATPGSGDATPAATESIGSTATPLAD